MFGEEEVKFQCPYCGQWISFLLEGLYGAQSYVEDCQVCCQPIQITYSTGEDQTVVLESVSRAD